jgi:hypothetical protein
MGEVAKLAVIVAHRIGVRVRRNLEGKQEHQAGYKRG